FGLDEPLSQEIIQRLIEVRRAQVLGH
ncbi:MAG: hypothetical protein RIS80_484, partial [Actinomycetota bacterium]